MPEVQVNGIELYYELEGADADPCIVLIRGLGTQMSEWPESLIRGLKEGGLQVLCFDNRDVGLSSKLDADYELSDMAHDVVALLTAVNIDSAHIFGISLGGMVAQLVAYLHPMKTISLIPVMTSSGNPDLPPMSADTLARLTRAGSTREEIVRISADNKLVFGSPGYPETEAQRQSASRSAYERCYYPEGVARQMRAVLSDGSRVERLHKISVPTLVIHGLDDSLIAHQAGKDVAHLITGAQLQLLPGMGHNIPESLGADIADRVLSFINLLEESPR